MPRDENQAGRPVEDMVMEFTFTKEEEAFRQEVRGFLKKELPSDWKGIRMGSDDDDFEFEMHMRKRLGERNWLALAWPKEHGGGGADVMHQMIFSEEMAYARAPGRDGFGVGMIGPSIIVHGTEEQKTEHLGRIARGEVHWCQGYSEPGAGSDLASLQTRAVRDGDDYVVNGQKVWTTFAHKADWIFMLTRTDPDAPKHRGITYLLADMKTPGIEVRPLINMANSHEFNEVYFNDVRIPARNVLGEENRGWYAAMTTLDFERSGVAYAAGHQRTLEDAIAYLKGPGVPTESSFKNPSVRYKLADLTIANETCRMLSYRVGWMQQSGQVPNTEASMMKVYSSELTQRITRTLMQIIGIPGQLGTKDPRAPMGGRVEHAYKASIANTIAAGTSEINRNVIATRGLGLPR